MAEATGSVTRCQILDDHSRYVLGLYGLRAFTAEEIYPCMVRSFERYGVPEAMLMDQGCVWVGDAKRIWADVAFGADDRTRDWIALRASESSADTEEGGEIPSHARRGAALSGQRLSGKVADG